MSWRSAAGISNQAMLRLGSSSASLQPKLAIGPVDDPLEQEADRVADQVMRAPAPEPAISGTPPQLSRKCAECEAADEGQMLQKKAATTSEPAAGGMPSAVYRTLRSPGQPLDASARGYFETRFGHDFSRVRIHSDSLAYQAAAAVNANAYTVGSDLVFAAGRYAPDTRQGKQLLAHELTHVVQQSGGSAQGLTSSGASVARLPISPSVIALHRDQKTPDPRALDRPGAQWPFGPITKHKSVTHDFSTYIGWVKEVERAYGPDKQAVLQRLRRLYYSSYSGNTGGAAFDKVIADQAGAGGPPLDARAIPATTLDGLYETNVLRLWTGALVDVSHVLAGLDLKTAGITYKASVAEALDVVSFMGVVTWTGDLASWFLNWIAGLGSAAPSFGPGSFSAAEFAAQKVDLLSDLDAQAVAQENVDPSTIEHVKAENRPIMHSNIGTELSEPVSAILEHYYGDPEHMGKAYDRFAAFVRTASPPIPHSSANADGSGPITLAADAESAIYEAISNTARLFIVESNSYPFGPEILDQKTSALHEMAQRFTQFLVTGLQHGDAPWP
jgi:Domain of unknown function (DUF4157)